MPDKDKKKRKLKKVEIKLDNTRVAPSISAAPVKMYKKTIKPLKQKGGFSKTIKKIKY